MSKFRNDVMRVSQLLPRTVRVPSNGSKLAIPRCSVNFRIVCKNPAMVSGIHQT